MNHKCKICYQIMDATSICSYHYQIDKDVEFVFTRRFYLRFDPLNSMIHIINWKTYNEIKSFSCSKLTPELAQEWLEKFKTYDLFD